MSFNVLYVENDQDDIREIVAAVNDRNNMGLAEPVHVEPALTPEELRDKLGLRFDLVLADVYFPDSDDSLPEQPQLDKIIAYVHEWSDKHAGRLLPIIAYTAWGRPALEWCLARSKDLHDIWDKTSASPAYAAWRLSRLAAEVSRMRPDAILLRKILGMPTGATWHSKVVQMARDYDSGWTELEQITKAGHSIKDIGHDGLGEGQATDDMWQAIVDWEPFGRAGSPGARGHARHVVNVFWMGYYLLHNEHLAPIFRDYWQSVLGERSQSALVRDEDPLQALSSTWFYAGLFHDIGNCVEKWSATSEKLTGLVAKFQDFAALQGTAKLAATGQLQERAAVLLDDIREPHKGRLAAALEKSVGDGKPDHGVMAALYLRNAITRGKQGWFAREAARAVSFHALIPGYVAERGAPSLSWQEEPLACLLLLCDQIQTWDRERDDQDPKDYSPQRAELSEMIVCQDGARPRVRLAVDYIPGRHVVRIPEIREPVRERLKQVLRDRPKLVLNRISDWPFGLDVSFSLNGEPLEPSVHRE